MTRDGDTRAVCELCRPRAEAAGWQLEGRDSVPLPVSREHGRGRLRRFMDRARESAAIATSREPADAGGRGQAPTAESAAVPPPVERRSQTVRRSVPQSAEQRIRRAFDVFNASEHKRTVAGLIRSLGAPSVSAVTGGETPTEVRITVAWELAWYQWEVDLTNPGQAISAIAKGDEIAEIAEDDRHWNARANESGDLQLGGAG
jgi:hypothetical protein